MGHKILTKKTSRATLANKRKMSQIQSRKQMSQIVEASGGSNKPLSLPSQINGGEAGREDVEKTLESHRSSLSSSSNQSVKKLSSAEIKINEDMENDSIELQMTETPDTTTTTNQRQKSRRASRRASQTNKTTKQIQSRKRRMSQKPKSLYSENSADSSAIVEANPQNHSRKGSSGFFSASPPPPTKTSSSTEHVEKLPSKGATHKKTKTSSSTQRIQKKQEGNLLTKIKDEFETMEASQEVAFRAFYNAQKIIRSSSPTRTE